MTTLIASHPFGSTITIAQLITHFSQPLSWEERYRQLLQLGKQLPTLTEEQKAFAKPVQGCENRVWLGWQQKDDQTFHFFAESDSRIVRGLLAILLAGIEGKTAQQLLSNDPLILFQQLGLSQQLSATRIQGLQALKQTMTDMLNSHQIV